MGRQKFNLIGKTQVVFGKFGMTALNRAVKSEKKAKGEAANLTIKTVNSKGGPLLIVMDRPIGGDEYTVMCQMN